MKKIFIIFSVITLLLISTPALAKENIFSDVDSNNDSYEAIVFMKSNNIVNGYNDGTFKPNNTVTRAEFTKILIGSKFEDTERTNCTPSKEFTDVQKEEWIHSYLCLANNKNILKGYDDNTFRKNQAISFKEAAKIIVKTFEYKIVESEPWHKAYIEILQMLRSIPISIDSADQEITRGEMSEIIYRIITETTNKPSKEFFRSDTIQNDILNNKALNNDLKITDLYIVTSKGSPPEAYAKIKGEYLNTCTIIKETNQRLTNRNIYLNILTKNTTQECEQKTVDFQKSIQINTKDILVNTTYTVLIDKFEKTFRLENSGTGSMKITEFDINVSGNPPTSLTANLEIEFPDTCYELQGINQSQSGNIFYINVNSYRRRDIMCEFEDQTLLKTVTFNIGGISPGTYAVSAHGKRRTFSVEEPVTP